MFNHRRRSELNGMVMVSTKLMFREFLFILLSYSNNLSNQPADWYLDIYSFLLPRFLKTISPSK